MALIDRAITGATARLATAENNLKESRGNHETIWKKQNQVELCKITLEALKHEKNHARVLEYLEQLIDKFETGQTIVDYDLAIAIDILEGRR